MTCRTAFLSLAPVFLALVTLAPLHAAPPAELAGRFVEFGENRLEFTDGFVGADGEEPIGYTYEVLDGLTAELVVSYLSSRRRDFTLNFLSDGTPNGYQEFDFLSTEPPLPPAFRSGSFAISEREVTPPTESSSPDSLVGLYLKVAGQRLEFLTSNSGRCFLPGESDYFFYEYRIEGAASARVEISYDDGIHERSLTLVFDEFGAPLSHTGTELTDGLVSGETEGAFSMGTNLHLADLKIGFGNSSDFRGNDRFNPAGRKQTVGTRSSSSATLLFPFAIENDGDNDAFRLRATRSRGNFKVAYFSVPARENLTAAITTGRYGTGPLEHLEERYFTMEVTPLRPRGAYRGRVEARSLTVEAARDSVQAHVQKIPARKRPHLGNLKGKGRGKAPVKGGGKPSRRK